MRKWSDIVKSPLWARLSPQTRVEYRNRYFDEVVAPKLAEKGLSVSQGRRLWNKATNKDVQRPTISYSTISKYEEPTTFESAISGIGSQLPPALQLGLAGGSLGTLASGLAPPQRLFPDLAYYHPGYLGRIAAGITSVLTSPEMYLPGLGILSAPIKFGLNRMMTSPESATVGGALKELGKGALLGGLFSGAAAGGAAAGRSLGAAIKGSTKATQIGAGAGALAGETAAFGVGAPIIERRAPTKEDLADAIGFVLGFRAAGRTISSVKGLAGRIWKAKETGRPLPTEVQQIAEKADKVLENNNIQRVEEFVGRPKEKPPEGAQPEEKSPVESKAPLEGPLEGQKEEITPKAPTPKESVPQISMSETIVSKTSPSMEPVQKAVAVDENFSKLISQIPSQEPPNQKEYRAQLMNVVRYNVDVASKGAEDGQTVIDNLLGQYENNVRRALSEIENYRDVSVTDRRASDFKSILANITKLRSDPKAMKGIWDASRGSTTKVNSILNRAILKDVKIKPGGITNADVVRKDQEVSEEKVSTNAPEGTEGQGGEDLHIPEQTQREATGGGKASRVPSEIEGVALNRRAAAMFRAAFGLEDKPHSERIAWEKLMSNTIKKNYHLPEYVRNVCNRINAEPHLPKVTLEERIGAAMEVLRLQSARKEILELMETSTDPVHRARYLQLITEEDFIRAAMERAASTTGRELGFHAFMLQQSGVWSPVWMLREWRAITHKSPTPEQAERIAKYHARIEELIKRVNDLMAKLPPEPIESTAQETLKTIVQADRALEKYEKGKTYGVEGIKYLEDAVWELTKGDEKRAAEISEKVARLRDALERNIIIPREAAEKQGRKGKSPEIAEAQKILSELRRALKLKEKAAEIRQKITQGVIEPRRSSRKDNIYTRELAAAQAELDTARQAYYDYVFAHAPIKPKDIFWGVFNFNVPLVFGFDLSFTANQLGMINTAYPQIIPKSLESSLRGAFRAKSANEVWEEMKQDPIYTPAAEAGAAFKDPNSPLRGPEEMFRNRLLHILNAKAKAGQLGIFNKPVRTFAGGIEISDRAFILGINRALLELNRLYLESTPGATVEDMRAANILFNTLVGRGRFGPHTEAFVSGMGSILGAPRLFMSRVYTIPRLGKGIWDKSTRRMSAHILGAWVSLRIGVLTLLYIAADTYGWPIKISFDPLSPDFALIRVGDRRYDLWGPIRSLARTMATLAIYPFRRPKGRAFIDIATRTFINRFSPALRFWVSMWSGEDVFNKKIKRLEIVRQGWTPLWLQDIWEIIQYGAGATEAAAGALGSFLGLGVFAYEDNPKKTNGIINNNINSIFKYPTFPAFQYGR